MEDSIELVRRNNMITKLPSSFNSLCSFCLCCFMLLLTSIFSNDCLIIWSRSTAFDAALFLKFQFSVARLRKDPLFDRLQCSYIMVINSIDCIHLSTVLGFICKASLSLGLEFILLNNLTSFRRMSYRCCKTF